MQGLVGLVHAGDVGLVYENAKHEGPFVLHCRISQVISMNPQAGIVFPEADFGDLNASAAFHRIS